MFKALSKNNIKKTMILTKGTIRTGNSYDIPFSSDTFTEGGDAQYEQVKILLTEFHKSKTNRKFQSLT